MKVLLRQIPENVLNKNLLCEDSIKTSSWERFKKPIFVKVLLKQIPENVLRKKPSFEKALLRHIPENVLSKTLLCEGSIKTNSWERFK